MLKIKPLNEFMSRYKVEVISKANFHYEGEGWSVLFEAVHDSYHSFLLLCYFIYYPILFAARLLERKVEV